MSNWLAARKLTLGLAVGLAIGTFANEAKAECSGNRCTDTVEKVYLHNNGNLYIQTAGNESDVGCTQNEGLQISGSNELRDQYLRILLAAQLSGRVAVIRVPSVGGCEVQYVMLQ